MRNLIDKIKNFFRNFLDKLKKEPVIIEEEEPVKEKRISDLEIKEQNFHYFQTFGDEQKLRIKNAITELLNADQSMKLEIENIDMEIESLKIIKEETIKMRNNNRVMLKDLMTTMQAEFPQKDNIYE